jgi:WD40 repeat protein
MSLPSSPFKGLASFGDSEHDRLFFFGRERESELVTANLMAARLTVLYGPSGVGKSSLLRASVARRLRSLVTTSADGEGVPVVAVVGGWRDDPVAAVAAAAGARPAVPLADALAERAVETGGELYLVLDQMEEYVLYHGRDGGPLADELEEVLTRPDLPVHVLLGVRDDALAELDAFKRRVPGLFGNLLRLDHLTRAAARAAIEGPLRIYAELGGVEMAAEEELVEAVLDQVAAGRVEQELSGRAVAAESRARRVEAPYLQLVLERLWEVERARGATTLRAATLAELGGAARIVEEHLERALARLGPDERLLVSRLFNHLVTPSGTKIAHAVDDLGRYAEAEPAVLEPILGELDSARILRRVPGRGGGPARYEIFHDVLAQAVLAWRDSHDAERALAAERQAARRRHRRLAILAGVALLALTIVAGLAVWALAERGEARDQSRSAKARELTVAALSQLDRDPELALLLALEAGAREWTPEVESALRDALIRARGVAALRLGSPVLAAAPVAGGVVAATSDGAIRDRRGRTQRVAPRLDAAAFAPGGGAVAAASRREVEVWRVGGGRTGPDLAFDAPVVRVAFDGMTVAAAAADGAVSARSRDGGRPFDVVLPERPTALAVRGDLLAVAAGKVVSVFDLSHGRLVTGLEPEPATVLGLAISPDGGSIVTTAADSGIRVRTIRDGALQSVMLGHDDLVTGAVLVPDGSRLVTIGGDGRGRVWETATARAFAVLAGHVAELRTVATSEDGRRAATGDVAGVVRLWDVTGDPILRVVGRTGSDAFALLWRNGPVPVAPPARDPRVDPRAELDGSTVRLRSGVVLRGHSNRVTSARYSADGSLVITASQDRDARIWDARTGESLATLSGHQGLVSDASLSADARWAVTAGPGAAALWDARTGARIAYLRGHSGIVLSAIFAPDGRTVATLGADGTIRSWRCGICGPFDELVQLARQRLDAVARRLSATEREAYGLQGP